MEKAFDLCKRYGITVKAAPTEGKPLARQRFLATANDGTEVSGVTDKDGKAEIDLKSGGKRSSQNLPSPGLVLTSKVTFPDVDKAR